MFQGMGWGKQGEGGGQRSREEFYVLDREGPELVDTKAVEQEVLQEGI
jgi:hypothetical protein